MKCRRQTCRRPACLCTPGYVEPLGAGMRVLVQTQHYCPVALSLLHSYVRARLQHCHSQCTENDSAEGVHGSLLKQTEYCPRCTFHWCLLTRNKQ